MTGCSVRSVKYTVFDLNNIVIILWLILLVREVASWKSLSSIIEKEQQEAISK